MFMSVPTTLISAPTTLIGVEEIRDRSIEGLTNTCDNAVSVLRNTITSLGTVLREQNYRLSQYKDVFAVPICNLERGKNSLEGLLSDIREQYQEVHNVDDRYFCNTYFKVKDLKDWGYRLVDYASATVALGVITIEAAKAQGATEERSGTMQHWGITGGFLLLSKVLSATTDYRNRKEREKESKRRQLVELKYRCDKAFEVAAMIDVLKAFNRSVDDLDPIELKTQFKRSIKAIKEENGGVVSESLAKEIKKGLGSLIEEKIFTKAGSIAVTQFKLEKRKLKKTFDAWNRLRFEIDSGPGVAGVGSREDAHRKAAVLVCVEPARGELRGVVVDLGAPLNKSQGLMRAELQYGTGIGARAAQVSDYLSPPNLMLQMGTNAHFQ